MAEEIKRPFPVVKRITLGGSDIVTLVTIPPDAGKISILFETNAGKFTFDVDDGDSVGTDYGSVTNDTWFELTWTPRAKRNTGRDAIGLASATGSTVVQVLVEG